MSMTSATGGENPEDCGVYNEYYNIQHGILSEFTCEGLDGHNNSLSWIEANANRMGATINTRPSSRRWSQLEAFEIFVKGRESGIASSSDGPKDERDRSKRGKRTSGVARFS